MLGERRWVVLGIAFIVVGGTVLFLSWLLFGSVGSCRDPWPGCRTVPFDWHIGLVGMILVTAGTGTLAYSARLKMKMDSGQTPMFISAIVMFVLFVLNTVIVFNPLISPYDFIRDSDRDGYTDDIDSFPKDGDRHMPTYLEVGITWENTSTNYTARISSVYVALDGEPTDTSVMRLEIRWLPNYFNAHSEEIGTLEEIESSWVKSVRYQDSAPIGSFGLDDSFSFDKSVFDAAADAYILDDAGYLVARFQIVA